MQQQYVWDARPMTEAGANNKTLWQKKPKARKIANQVSGHGRWLSLLLCWWFLVEKQFYSGFISVYKP